MNFEKVFFISFTTNGLERINELPIDFNISSVLKDVLVTKIINVGETNWIEENDKIRYIQKEIMLTEGLSPTSAISFINDFCKKNDVKTLFSPDYQNDIKLLSNLEEESFIPPNFKLKDFYAGINPYQKTFWKHLYETQRKKTLTINFNAEEKNKLFIKNFKKVIDIHKLNSSA